MLKWSKVQWWSQNVCGWNDKYCVQEILWIKIYEIEIKKNKNCVDGWEIYLFPYLMKFECTVQTKVS